MTSPSIPRRLAALAAVSALAFALSAAPALADTRGDGHGDGHNLTCAGGSIAPGTYDNVTVTGFCTVDSGSITVRHDLVVKSGAALIALFGGSDFTVRSDVTVSTISRSRRTACWRSAAGPRQIPPASTIPATRRSAPPAASVTT